MTLTFNLKNIATDQAGKLVTKWLDGGKLTIEEYDILVAQKVIRSNPLTRGAGKPSKSTPKYKRKR